MVYEDYIPHIGIVEVYDEDGKYQDQDDEEESGGLELTTEDRESLLRADSRATPISTSDIRDSNHELGKRFFGGDWVPGD